MNCKKWLIIFFIIIITLVLISLMTIYIIDPYFHYHKPLSFIKYNLENERYINNGIVKHFNYDAMITGTSHTENFKTSEFDNLFCCNSIKVSLAGAEFKELADQMKVAIKYNPNIKYILYGINYETILNDKDSKRYNSYPTYLYDENIFNDYKYLFSGQAFIKSLNTIIYTLNKNETTSFDKYAVWDNNDGTIKFSKKSVLSKYKRRKEKIISNEGLTQKEKNKLMENINQNFTDVINTNKNITFYLFLTPHSIVWWDSISQNGTILKFLEAQEIFIDSLLKHDNVKIYSFFNNYDLICNLNNYKDTTHYSKNINSLILKWIKNDEYLITRQNKDEYLNKEKSFYLNYNYDKIFSDN